MITPSQRQLDDLIEELKDRGVSGEYDENIISRAELAHALMIVRAIINEFLETEGKK